ncbi:MAG: 23S rRNA (guanosine(2251)-2'-O)-methyltransferase RlmB [Christensenellaceae bacterium]|nr:23S rRNA (guanosine(2251)-2'-O)-methyltransferase RlmB [Christensenellaceae bacterium]
MTNYNKTDANVDENILIGRNPIREALKSGRDIEKILVQKGEISGSAREIIAKAREQKIIVQEVEKIRLDNVAPNHQGLVAFVSAYEYHDIDDILELAKTRGEEPFIIMLDGITDPHNLGAIIRSAECAGAHGIIIPSRRSAGLTATAVKASSGAVEHIHVAKVTNLVSTIQSLKKEGLWVYAADMEGEDYREVDFSGPVVLVIGAEGEGISKLVLENCDKKVSIPLKGQIQSLNASVAAGILMFEVMKGR